ncbi:MAG TPA: sel1 repeat family protein, partial [Flavobacterium sp.]|nr:sel1 repeat family protein [Flavobacterium sp.]
KEGAAKGNASCMYGQGYMHYKGLGTKQDYAAAISLFENAIKKNSTGSMYMLG